MESSKDGSNKLRDLRASVVKLLWVITLCLRGENAVLMTYEPACVQLPALPRPVISRNVPAGPGIEVG